MRPYCLIILIALLLVGSRWNTIGKATYVSNILPTRGPGTLGTLARFLLMTTDSTMRLRLVDPSLPTGLLINIFARDKSSFPLAAEGAILRLSQLEVMLAVSDSSCL